MDTFFVTSPDKVRIAFDRIGAGPALVLVHGGGGNRREWHETGYVERLQEYFTVITLDLRGHGESDQPTEPTAYSTDKMGQDILAVADACGVEGFTLWAMSFGGKISRYLAAQSDRITRAILMGTTLGPGASEKIRNEIEDFCRHWPPILQAQSDGTLDLDTLSDDDRNFLQSFNVPVIMAWGRAMLDWPPINPADFRCPTLLVAGSNDRPVFDSIMEHEQSLKGSKVQVHIVEGLDHSQVFDDIDRVFSTMLSFSLS